VYIARPRRRCATEVPAPGAPIDNRWNKKLEFVYSLVTQIRAAARHPRPTLSKPSPVGRTLATTAAADISDQHKSAFPLPTTLSAVRHHQHHYRRRTTLYLVTNDAVRGTNTSRKQSGATKAPAAVTQADHLYPVAVTDTSTVYPPLVSLYFSPLFSARAPFRSVRRVCRTTCSSWPRMHLSNGETNW